MKNALIIVSLLISQTVFAQINNSQNNPRHQAAIVTAIENNCGYMRDLTQIAQTEEVIRVDNGITDRKYTTILSGFKRLDQYIFDEYEIVVNSDYADMYDHAAQDWGSYSVSSVTCNMK